MHQVVPFYLLLILTSLPSTTKRSVFEFLFNILFPRVVIFLKNPQVFSVQKKLMNCFMKTKFSKIGDQPRAGDGVNCF